MNDIERLIKYCGNRAKYFANEAEEFANSQNDELMLQVARYENVAKDYALITEALYALREKERKRTEG